MISFTILGQPYSKSNSRRIVYGKGRPLVIKSANALAYLKAFRAQCPKLPALLEGDLAVTVRIWYQSRRSDVDPSLILDAMQGVIYGNDRQVREINAAGFIDKENPRAEIEVWALRDLGDRHIESGFSAGHKRRR